jgi:pyruvate kinase
MHIVCTIIPDARGVELFPEVYHAGMTALRLNFSHLDPDGAARLVKAVRTFNELTGRDVGTMQDLRGRKMVLGRVPGGEQEVAPGAPVRFVEPGGERDQGRYGGLVVPIRLDQPFPDLRSAERIVGKDATLEFEITDNRADTEGWIQTEVLRGGVLRTHKGVNAPGIERPRTLTSRDLEDIRLGLRLGVDRVCLSFVSGTEEVEQARRELGRSRRKTIPEVWAKIECAEALADAKRIVEACDGVVIGRGDLAAETSRHEVPAAQSRITRIAVESGKPCLVATGVLESLRRSSNPTFAELRDIHRSLDEGVSGFVLTSETSVGRNGALAVEVLLEAERARSSRKRRRRTAARR